MKNYGLATLLVVAIAVGLFGGHFILMEVASFDDDWSPLRKELAFWLSLAVPPAFGVWAGRQIWEFAYKTFRRP